MKKHTILNLLLILFVLSFFITPLGYESKILLQRIFASSVDIIPADKAQKIDFSWQLKDRNDVQFNYSQTEGKKPFTKLYIPPLIVNAVSVLWRMTSARFLVGSI